MLSQANYYDTRRRRYKRSQKKIETFWFFRLRFRRAYDFTTLIFYFHLVINLKKADRKGKHQILYELA